VVVVVVVEQASDKRGVSPRMERAKRVRQPVLAAVPVGIQFYFGRYSRIRFHAFTYSLSRIHVFGCPLSRIRLPAITHSAARIYVFGCPHSRIRLPAITHSAARIYVFGCPHSRIRLPAAMVIMDFYNKFFSLVLWFFRFAATAITARRYETHGLLPWLSLTTEQAFILYDYASNYRVLVTHYIQYRRRRRACRGPLEVVGISTRKKR
jgi:hypothetical protein